MHVAESAPLIVGRLHSKNCCCIRAAVGKRQSVDKLSVVASVFWRLQSASVKHLAVRSHSTDFKDSVAMAPKFSRLVAHESDAIDLHGSEDEGKHKKREKQGKKEKREKEEKRKQNEKKKEKTKRERKS